MSEFRSMQRHPRAVTERPGHVGSGRTDPRGPFATENLGSIGSRIGVVLESLRHHFLHVAIVMFVHQIRRPAFDPQRLGLFVTAGGNDFQLRILLLDRVVELAEPSVVGAISIGAAAVKPIFVSDLHIGHLEGLGMSILGALRAPFGGLGVAGEILDLFEGFLNVGIELSDPLR